MATTEQRNHAKSYLKKAKEYFALSRRQPRRRTSHPPAGDAIHAGITSNLSCIAGADPSRLSGGISG